MDTPLQTDSDGNLTWEDEHLDTIRKWAAAAESLIHGRASGLDAAVCTYGQYSIFGFGSLTKSSDPSNHPQSLSYSLPEPD